MLRYPVGSNGFSGDTKMDSLSPEREGTGRDGGVLMSSQGRLNEATALFEATL